MNRRPSNSRLRCSITEPQRLNGERGLLRSSYDKSASARISKINSVMFVNGIREMRSFVLGKGNRENPPTESEKHPSLINKLLPTTKRL